MFGPKSVHYYVVFGKKVIPHDRVLEQTNKIVISDILFPKVHITLFSNDDFDFSKIFEKIENQKTARVLTQIGTLFLDLRQKSHTSQRRARKNQNQGLFSFWPTYRFSKRQKK